jgi:aspartate carbamoyltransferase catalytic subunit
MARSHLSVSHLLGIKDLTVSDIEQIFQTADEFMNVLSRPIKKVPSLNDICVANLFFENSTRTRVSFELAQRRLSADIVNFSASTSSVAKGETLLDTVQNILAMKVDMIVIRHSKPGAPHFLARHITANIINAGDGTHEHPTQALLDGYTLLQKFGTLKGLKVGILGDILHSRVALSNIFLLNKLGAEVKVCAPPTLLPKYVESLGVTIEYDRTKFLNWCDAVNVLRIQLERQNIRYFPSSREYTALFGITPEVLAGIGKPLTILHPGPINRGVELTTEVADSPQALILDQVTHGVAVRMAVLYLLAGR